MNLESFYEYCLSKKGVTEHFPFDHDTLVFKVGRKIVALSSLSKWEQGKPSINLKCDPTHAIELRMEYDDIKAGFHMNKKHWNTVNVNKTVSNILVNQLIDQSFELVFKSLTKKAQNEILNI